MRLPLILMSTALLAACSQPAPPPAAAANDAPPPMQASATATPAADDAPAPMTGAPPPMTGAPPPMTGAAPAGADAPADGASQGDARQRIGQLLGDVAPYETVFTTLQKGVAANDAKAVAALPIYPLRVNVGGKERKIADAAAFEREYDSIITADIAKAIAAQKFDDLFVNWKGVMLGKGQVWINGICADNTCAHPQVGIVAIQD
ncbi:hypothetical protein [Stenotrophomonas sp. 24(2023)]|uniref:hypothetical protein n=1 Tax=Stenotrophomonas sp. 24(2023) TaxID=3068324 RepID=UPI0027E105C0|nr:hypothetical protein [Stenotrophomonas sp. 24(2023)]WMJ67600.1 hypothetical protein Q9R17_10210 [Stenotrophomonas sp. 24(2023)]